MSFKRLPLLPSNGGYTIIEVMIFLVVTATLFISAMAVFNGRQARTEYTQAVRETDQRILTVINEVGSGNFPDQGNFSCTSSSSGTVIDVSGSEEQGSNESCIFVGKLMHFGIDGDERDYAVYTLAGSRLDGSSGQIVTNLAEASPTVVQSLTETFRVPYGGKVFKVVAPDCENNGDNKQIAGFAVTQTFGEVSDGDPISGSQSVRVQPLCGTNFGDAGSAVFSVAENANKYRNAPRGITLCFGEPGARVSALRIGGGDRESSTEVLIDNPPAECTS